MKYLILIVFFVIGSSELKAQEWTEENTAWETAYLATLIIDWGQTLEIAENPNYRELNQIIGEYPTRGEVNRYFMGLGISHIIISNYLDEWRLPWQRSTFFFSLGVISRNARMGIKINF